MQNRAGDPLPYQARGKDERLGLADWKGTVIQVGLLPVCRERKPKSKPGQGLCFTNKFFPLACFIDEKAQSRHPHDQHSGKG